MSRVPVNLTSEQEVDFKSRYVDGESLKNLAEEVGCSTATMSRKLTSLGCTIRGRGRPRKQLELPTPPPEPVEQDPEVDLPPEWQSEKPDSRFQW